MSVPELSRRSSLAVTTIYELENGRSKGTTKLHELAVALNNCSVHWLKSGKGSPDAKDQPSLSIAEVTPDYVAWPFEFDPDRWHRLLPAQREQIERVVLLLIRDFEEGGKTPPARRAPRRR